MKKIIAIAAALLLGFAANAQVISTLGYTFEWSPFKDEGNTYRVAEMNGLYAGALYNYVLLDFGLGVAGGTYVSFSSGTDRIPGIGKDLKVGVYRNCHRHIAITIPAYVTFTRELGPGSLFAYGGVAFQGGFLFQAYTKYPDGSRENGENQFRLYSGYRPYDLKVSFGAGYRWKFLQADMGMDFGTIDRYPDPYLSYRIHSFHIGISYVY